MKWLLKLVKFGLTLAIIGAFAGAAALAAAYYYLEPDLPDIDNLRDVRLQVPLKVLSRDGMLIGVNVEATVRMAEATEIPVIASGGVTSLEDLAALKSAFQNASGTLMGADSNTLYFPVVASVTGAPK